MKVTELGIFGNGRCPDCNGREFARNVSYGGVGWTEITTRHQASCPQVVGRPKPWRRKSPKAARREH